MFAFKYHVLKITDNMCELLRLLVVFFVVFTSYMTNL